MDAKAAARETIDDTREALTTLSREIHAHPELAFEHDGRGDRRDPTPIAGSVDDVDGVYTHVSKMARPGDEFPRLPTARRRELDTSDEVTVSKTAPQRRTGSEGNHFATRRLR